MSHKGVAVVTTRDTRLHKASRCVSLSYYAISRLVGAAGEIATVRKALLLPPKAHSLHASTRSTIQWMEVSQHGCDAALLIYDVVYGKRAVHCAISTLSDAPAQNPTLL